MCFTFEESGDCKFGERCRFRHGEMDARFDAEGCRDVSQEICRDFRAGRCRLGEECPRQHIDAPEGEEQGGGGGGGRRKKTREPREVKKIDEVCENYLAGRCRYGDQCRRVHQGEIQQTVEKVSALTKTSLCARRQPIIGSPPLPP